MASGDKIFVADKETLDIVNDKLGNLEDAPGSSSMFSILKSIDASSKDFPTQIYDTQKFVVGGTIYPASTTAPVLNLAGSGYLYAVLATHIVANSGATSPTGALQVYRDNQLVINRNIATNTGSGLDSSGILCSTYAPIGSGELYIAGNSHRVLTAATTIRPFNTSSIGVTFIPVPLRFEDSIRVNLSNTSSAVGVSYIYLLD